MLTEPLVQVGQFAGNRGIGAQLVQRPIRRFLRFIFGPTWLADDQSRRYQQTYHHQPENHPSAVHCNLLAKNVTFHGKQWLFSSRCYSKMHTISGRFFFSQSMQISARRLLTLGLFSDSVFWLSSIPPPSTYPIHTGKSVLEEVPYRDQPLTFDGRTERRKWALIDLVP